MLMLTHWPLSFICAAMIVAAVIDGWKLKVPNWLTFPLVLGGWALGISHNFDLLAGTGAGGFGASFAGTMFGFVLLFPVYAIGGMGGGDVKMQMGFGAWIGAFYGFEGNALSIIWWAFALAVIIGGVLATIMIVIRGKLRQNLLNTREILGDLTGTIASASEKAAARKPRMHLLPYGIPLCLGFIGYLFLLHG
jgi:prepilin peptidase CpaA